MKQAGNLGEQESNAMYVQSQAHLDTLKTNAKIEMIKNPGQAGKIAEKVAEGFSSITQDAVVNKGDRSRLNLSANSDLNDLRIDAARAEVGVAKKSGAISFYSNWPTVLSGVKSSIGNEQEFNNRVKSAQEMIASMVSSEAITMKQGATYFASLQGAIEAGHQYMRASMDNTLTAKDYHKLKGGMAPIDDGTHMGEPVDHNTAHLYESQSLDLTKKTLRADIAAGGNGQGAAWGQLSKNEIAY